MSDDNVSDSPQPESPQAGSPAEEVEEGIPVPAASQHNSQEDEILSHFQEVTGMYNLLIAFQL